MILFLLKNRRLRVQLFVGLLLVIGIIPERSEGLQCYQCELDKDKKTDCSTSKTVTCDEAEEETACVVQGARGTVGSKACTSKLLGTCLVDLGYAGEGSQCGLIPLKDALDTKTLQEKLLLCFIKNSVGRSTFDGSLKGRQGGKHDFDIKQCVCDTDLCNTDTEDLLYIPAPPTTAAPRPVGSSQQQQTSNSKLIFAILTTAVFYTYN